MTPAKPTAEDEKEITEVFKRIAVDQSKEDFYPPIPTDLLDPTGTRDQPSILPGFQGLPFRGRVPNLKTDDPEYKQPQVASRIFVRVFDLSKPKDLEYYEKVSQLVGNGFAVISIEDKVFDEKLHNWRVLLRWMVQYSYVPKGA